MIRIPISAIVPIQDANKPKLKTINKKLAIWLLVILMANFCTAGQEPHETTGDTYSTAQPSLANPTLVRSFYALNQEKLFWFPHPDSNLFMRRSLIAAIDSAKYLGLDRSNYNTDLLLSESVRSFQAGDSLLAMTMDMIFADAAISLCKDIYCGSNISSLVNADEISSKFAARDNAYILNGLLQAHNDKNLLAFIRSLEPSNKAYLNLKNVFRDSLLAGSRKNTVLINALNLHRWIDHFALSNYILVNIPSALCQYYRQDSMVLNMKAVLGKITTQTPRFAAYCNQIILYPFWNVPRKIAVRELLPLFKQFPRMVDSMNMQLLDNKGNIINPQSLNWSIYNKDNFPFLVRQSTGCDNALGVVKFNLTSPYDVYMHDTNLKSAFQSNHRYYSHGCIRLEKPLALANYLVVNGLDSNYLLSCLKGQIPQIVQLEEPVAVFVVYINAETNPAGKLQYYQDVYSLLHKPGL